MRGQSGLHSRLTHVVAEDGEIRGVVVDTRGGRIVLRARVYVDASGDAVLSRLAGADVLTGETLQYPSMMFTMQNVDVGMAVAAIAELPGILEAHFETERLPRRSGSLIPTGRPGEVVVALSRVEFAGRPVDAPVEVQLGMGGVVAHQRFLLLDPARREDG